MCERPTLLLFIFSGTSLMHIFFGRFKISQLEQFPFYLMKLSKIEPTLESRINIALRFLFF
jgi:hypothetical protein